MRGANLVTFSSHPLEYKTAVGGGAVVCTAASVVLSVFGYSHGWPLVEAASVC